MFTFMIYSGEETSYNHSFHVKWIARYDHIFRKRAFIKFISGIRWGYMWLKPVNEGKSYLGRIIPPLSGYYKMLIIILCSLNKSCNWSLTNQKTFRETNCNELISHFYEWKLYGVRKVRYSKISSEPAQLFLYGIYRNKFSRTLTYYDTNVTIPTKFSIKAEVSESLQNSNA